MSQGQRIAGRIRRLRPAVLLWTSCAGAALVLTLGASGTLSSWTQAIITNSNNSVATGKAVILQETGPASQSSPVCISSSAASNSYTCTTINKYGGTTTPLMPGGSVTTDVTFTNVGGANASTFALTPGTCSSAPTSGTPTPTNLCTATGALTVAVACNTGTTFGTGTAWASPYPVAATQPGNLTSAGYTHNAAAGDLNANASWTCRVTVALDANTPIAAQAVTVTQPLTWTLSQ
jgi:hypothetical protein